MENKWLLEPQEVRALVQEHLERYPLMESQDLYLLARETLFGPAYGEDSEALEDKRWALLLAQAQELQDEEPRAWEVPVEILHPHLGLARVHLRSYLRSGGQLARLRNALNGTFEEVEEFEPGILAQLLGLMRAELVQRGIGSIDIGSFDQFLRTQVVRGMPSLPASDTYLARYDPRYCVVFVDLFS